MNMDRRDFVRQSTAFAATSAFLPACAKDISGKGNANMKIKVTKDKVLVVYFSRSGNTRYVAETFAKACGGVRLVEIKAAKPYASDYGACCDEAKPECAAGTLRPIEKIAGPDVAAYDVVLVGTPNWWGTLAPPCVWKRQTVFAFSAAAFSLTHVRTGGGMQNCARDFAALVEGATVLPAESYYGATVKVRPGLKSFVAYRLAVEG